MLAPAADALVYLAVDSAIDLAIEPALEPISEPATVWNIARHRSRCRFTRGCGLYCGYMAVSIAASM
eukprot:5364382-Lingulodinium_polyedra.AAC.1